MTFRRDTPSRGGATAVEFAVVAPLFFVLVLGMVEVGRACMVNELLTEAARLGCRQGVLEGTSSASIKSAAVNYLSSVGIGTETVGVSVNDAPVDTVEAQNMPSYTEITVVVSVPARNVTWVPTLFVRGTISAQYTMRRE